MILDIYYQMGHTGWEHFFCFPTFYKPQYPSLHSHWLEASVKGWETFGVERKLLKEAFWSWRFEIPNKKTRDIQAIL